MNSIHLKQLSLYPQNTASTWACYLLTFLQNKPMSPSLKLQKYQRNEFKIAEVLDPHQDYRVKLRLH